MAEKASIIYLNTIFDIDERFRIMFIPDIGDERKKQEVVQKTHSFYEVLLDEVAAVYNFFETVRSDTQQRSVSVTEVFNKTETKLKDIPGDTNIEKLETIGKKIYQSLFPDQLKKYIADNPIDTIVLLSTNFMVPFELMHDGESFLATKYDIYRSPILDDVPSIKISEKENDETSHIAIVTNPTGDLPAAEKETDQIIKFFEAKKELDLQIDVYSKKGATYRALSKIFAQPRLDVFHYCGHSGVTSDDIYFHLPDDPFSVIDIYLQYPALFFLNMCESDIKVLQKVAFKGLETLNFPLAIMKRGAKACLATLWPIVDASAAQFATSFYKNVLKGEPFGTSVRLAKEHLANTSDPNDITWLSFILYGNPGFSTITIPRKKEPAKVEEPAEAPPKGLTVFLSYAKQDSRTFHIAEIARGLEQEPKVDKVYYHERDFTNNIAAYMNKNIAESDVVIIFCSQNSLKSFNVQNEIRTASLTRKEIIPVYLDTKDIPVMLKSRLGIRFDPSSTQGAIMQLRTKVNMVVPK
ncbi:MAG TPA: CHAT domain-containing protein [Candidatus Deferrimicrobium sp.]|nr:CHAT domain-containing protein [Candidatus Deferrimicrobium sp.]